jgi:ribosomal-protein-alanine N-acetyltransferase
VEYRLYKPEDFPALYAVERACFEAPLRFSRSYMLRLVAQRNGAVWVAEEEGRLCGFAIVEWAREGAIVAAYIQTLEVLAENRKAGVGKELLARLEQSAQASGSSTVRLHVDAHNVAALRLYRAQKYVEQGSEENYYGQGRSALALAKQLVPDEEAG